MNLVKIGEAKAVPEMLSMKIAERTVVIPETVYVENVRFAQPSGTFAQGDVLVGNFKLYDAEGNEKPLEYSDFKVNLVEYPIEKDKELLCVFYCDFVVSNKAVIEDEKIVVEDEKVVPIGEKIIEEKI